MDTLHQVKDKYSEESNGLTLEEARAIKTELHNIQKSLTVGEQEKIELMKNLSRLKDDLTRIQHSDSTFDVNKQGVSDRLSTASQTDLSGEVSTIQSLITHPNSSAQSLLNFLLIFLQLVPVGARLAEMARIRLQYDETRQQVQHIQQVIFFPYIEYVLI